VLGFVEADPHVRLGGQVVYLVRVDRRDQRDQSGSVAQVAVVQEEAGARLVRIDVEVVDARRVERGGTADQAMHLVTLGQQQFGQVGTVLPGDTGDQRLLHRFTRRGVEVMCTGRSICLPTFG
jgi:hypothetical protein